MRRAWPEWWGLLVVVALAVAAVGALRPAFLSGYNVQVLLAAVAINVLVAYSQAIIIALGQMNLAVGAIGGLAAIAFAGAMEAWGLPPPLAVALGLAVGLGAGVANGWLVATTGLSSFIVTLGTLYVFNGITLGLTEAQPFYGIPQGVKDFGEARLLGPIPLLALPALAATLALAVLLARLRIGRHILAAGGNPAAAGLGGVPVGAATVWAHGLSGLLAATAGIVLVARLQIGQPTIGNDWLILSFAAPVIGGAALAGGHVSVAGTLLGVVLIAVLTQALVLFDVDPFAVQIALGLLILGAVGLARLRGVRLRAAP